jgi:hypothetical protein
MNALCINTMSKKIDTWFQKLTLRKVYIYVCCAVPVDAKPLQDQVFFLCLASDANIIDEHHRHLLCHSEFGPSTFEKSPDRAENTVYLLLVLVVDIAPHLVQDLQ